MKQPPRSSSTTTFRSAGQGILSKIGEYPVRSDVPAPTVLGVTLPAITSKQYFRMSTQDALKYSKDDLSKWNADFKFSK
ncbi:hypothetical protein CDEF62S_05170 [Castellaniella defragrans]